MTNRFIRIPTTNKLTFGSITLNNAGIKTSSAKGASANINLKSGNKIKLGEVRSNLNFDNGNGGNIKIEAINQVSLNSVFSRSSQAFNSGNIKIISQNAGIDFTWTGDNNPGISTRSEAGMPGSITVQAFGDITKNALDGEIRSWSENGGKAGNVKISSSKGKVLLGKTPIRAWADVKDAGNVKVEASGDLEIGAIASNVVAGLGKGGNISLTGNNIIAESLRADSFGAEGGEIKLYASKFIQVTGSTLVNGNEYSIFTDSKDVNPTTNDTGARSAAIWIRHSFGVNNETLTPFIVGDSSKNGTANSISDGIVDFGVSAGRREIYGSKFDFNDIHIIRPSALVSGNPVSDDDISKAFNTIAAFIVGGTYGFPLINDLKSLISQYPGITKSELFKIAPYANRTLVNELLPYLNITMAIYGITTPIRKAHFLAQLLQESDSFNATSEYASGEEYEGRINLGNTQPGDGKRFKGRGLIQLTGRANYNNFSNYLGLATTFEFIPGIISTNPALVALSAGYYWKVNTGRNLSLIADQDNGQNSEKILKDITISVNGDITEDSPTYLSRRREFLRIAKKAFGVPT
jgi:predicted chitinase